MAPLVLLLLSLSAAQDPIRVDVPSSLSITQQVSGSMQYKVPIDWKKDLLMLLTYSSQAPPQLYLEVYEEATGASHTLGGQEWGNNTLVVVSDYKGSLYYARVSWTGACAYNLSFKYVNWSQISEPLKVGHAAKDSIVSWFYATTNDDWLNRRDFTFTVTPYDPKAQMQVLMGSGSSEYEALQSIWPLGYQVRAFNNQERTKYKIIIQALSDLDYMIAVQQTGKPLNLQSDVLVRGTTEPQTFTYYNLTNRELWYRVEMIQVQLTALEGQPIAYLGRGRLPTLANFYTRTSSTNQTIFLQKWHLNDYTYLGVYGKEKAAYTLYYSYSTFTLKPLFTGLPQSGFVYGELTSQYTVSFDTSMGKYAEFRVKAVEGYTNAYGKRCLGCEFTDDIDMYKYPMLFGLYYSRSSESDSYVIVPLDAQSCPKNPCEYTIAVVCADPTQSASFLLSVDYQKERRHTWLLANSPVIMTVQQDYFYYKYTCSSPQVGTVAFQLSALVGSSTLYISRETVWPEKSDYEKTNTALESEILYRRGVDGVLTGTYYIAVYADTLATYTLTAQETLSPPTNPIKLHLGKPQQGIVHENTPEEPESDMSLYRFDASFSGNREPVLLLSLSSHGNFTLCAGTSQDIWPYDSDQYQWCLPYASSSVLRIAATDPNYCTNCAYFILVRGWKFSADHSAVFTLTYTVETPIIHLQDSLPYKSEATKDQYQFYSFSLVQGYTDLNINFTPFTGEPEIYLLFSSSEVRPDKENAQLSSVDSSEFSINWEEVLKFCLIGSPQNVPRTKFHCNCYLGVYCATSFCSYILTVSQNLVQPILEEVTLVGSVQSGTYDYYKFENQVNSALIVTLAATCTLSLYVNPASRGLPTAENNTWRTTVKGTEQLLLHPTDPVFAGSGSMQGDYLIGVSGVASCSYRLTVVRDSASVKELLEGVSEHGVIVPFGEQYFQFTNSRNEAVTITLSPKSGSALLRVNALRTSSLSESLPQRSSSTWFSPVSEQEQHIVISSTDANFRKDCTFLIGVFTEQESCSFSISVSTGKEALLLRSGVSTFGEVSRSAWIHYTFSLLTYSDIHISVINYSGDADVYVSTEATVSASSAFWLSVTSNPAEQIAILAVDPQMVLGNYSIGVYGSRNSTYSITVHTKEDPVTLIDGWPLAYSFPQGSESSITFKYYMEQSSIAVPCHLSRQGAGFWPKVEVSFEPLGSSNSPVQPLSYDRKDYDPLYDSLTFSLPTSRETGTYFLSVQSMDEVGTFALRCGSFSSSSLLLAGRAEFAVLSKSLPKLTYQIAVSEAGLLRVVAVPCSGRISMTISSSSPGDNPDVVFTKGLEGIQAEMINGFGLYLVTISSLDDPIEANFQLSYTFHPQDIRRPKRVTAGREGRIDWEKDSDSLRLTWTEPQYEDGSPITDPVLYIVEVTNDTEARMDSLCGMRAAHSQQVAWTATPHHINETATELTVEADQVYVLNVIGYIATSSGVVPLVYTPITVSSPGPFSVERIEEVIIAIGSGLAAGALVLVAVLLYCWKCRQTAHSLRTEMQDTNRASMSSDALELAQKQVAIYQPMELPKT